jgi:hypothetical protein
VAVKLVGDYDVDLPKDVEEQMSNKFKYLNHFFNETSVLLYQHQLIPTGFGKVYY